MPTAEEFYNRLKAIADDLFDDDPELAEGFIERGMTKKGYVKKSSWAEKEPEGKDGKTLNFKSKATGTGGQGWQYE